MCKRGPTSHSCHPRTQWAQAHCTLEALDPQLRLAEKFFSHPPEIPCPGKFEMEPRRPIDKGGPYFEIATDKRSRPPAGGECDRVILAQVNRPLGEPLHFGDLVRRA